ncbi:MAG: NAD(P)H-hydrate epimerase, partial [Dehalococcoidia bacterium]|nr:NAD(P)H-hydrate epimerase [Dehalococcoidia bacterium]
MLKIVTAEQMRSIEARAVGLGVSVNSLMENAGLAVATTVRDWMGDVGGKAVVVLAGPGNNGGDGLVAARHLQDWGARVNVYVFGRRSENDPNLAQALQRNIPLANQKDDADLSILREMLSRADAAIDALLGTGKARAIEEPLAGILKALKEARGASPGLKLVALDLPTGLDPDSGAIDPNCVAADLTITLGYPKLGLFRFPGASRLGKLVVADIGIPPGQAEDVDL